MFGRGNKSTTEPEVDYVIAVLTAGFDILSQNPELVTTLATKLQKKSQALQKQASGIQLTEQEQSDLKFENSDIFKEIKSHGTLKRVMNAPMKNLKAARGNFAALEERKRKAAATQQQSTIR
jgi:uncharacterized protein (UPF0335 family)